MRKEKKGKRNIKLLFDKTVKHKCRYCNSSLRLKNGICYMCGREYD